MLKAAYVFDEDVDFYNDERVKFFGIHASYEGKIVTFGGGVPLKRTPLAATPISARKRTSTRLFTCPRDGTSVKLQLTRTSI